MYRRRVELQADVGRPAATLTVGDSGGRLCYVTASMSAVAIAVPLDGTQVDQLIAGLVAWREERAADQRAFTRPCRTAQSANAAVV